MLFRYFLTSSGLLLSLLLTAQCPNGDVVLFTQAGIEAFTTDFPDCTALQGNLQLGDSQTFSNITNLSSLSQINSIAGDLLILNNDELISLEGLDRVTAIQGSVNIAFNNILTDVQTLRSLNTLIGDLNINFNIGLQQIDTLEQLVAIGGNVNIGGNPQLQNLLGLESLASIGGTLDIFSNTELISLAGLDNITQIGGGLFLSENEGLVDISALNSIESLGGNLAFTENPGLQNLDALSNLERINGRLTLFANSTLSDITGLGNIRPETINNLDIRNNPLLSFCAVRSICQYLQSEAGPALIENNAEGCSTPEEVESACPLLGNICFDAVSVNNLLGQALDQAQFSSLFDNTAYTATDNPADGFECFFSTSDTVITNSIWFRFTGDGNEYHMTTANCDATDYIDLGETQMALYQGSCDNLSPVACNENADDDIPLLNGQISISTEEGVEYFLLVDGTTSPVSDGIGEYCLEVTRFMTTDVLEENTAQVLLFPNPTSGLLHINGISAEAVLVYTVEGQFLSRLKPSDNTVDLGTIPAGIYYLQITDSEQRYQAKVVKTN
mgnify:CR=1 FL=1